MSAGTGACTRTRQLGKIIRRAYRLAASQGLHAALRYLQEKIPVAA